MLVLGERIEFNPVLKPGYVGSGIVGRVTVTDSWERKWESIWLWCSSKFSRKTKRKLRFYCAQIRAVAGFNLQSINQVRHSNSNGHLVPHIFLVQLLTSYIYISVFKIIGKIKYHGLNRAQRFCYINLWQIMTWLMQYFWIYEFVIQISQTCHLLNKFSLSDKCARKSRKCKF